MYFYLDTIIYNIVNNKIPGKQASNSIHPTSNSVPQSKNIFPHTHIQDMWNISGTYVLSSDNALKNYVKKVFYKN